MPELTVTLDPATLSRTRAALREIPHQLPKAMAGAVNDTSRKGVTALSRKIREEVNIKKRDIDRYIKRSYATPEKPSSQITLSESERLPLKYFGAKQSRAGVKTEKAGVSYKIKKGGSKKFIWRAFISKELGGHVFKRKGKARLPINKLQGPSPWGVAANSNIPEQTASEAQAELEKNLGRRVNMLLLKHAGKI